jgi:hypothetical protein
MAAPRPVGVSQEETATDAPIAKIAAKYLLFISAETDFAPLATAQRRHGFIQGFSTNPYCGARH